MVASEGCRYRTKCTKQTIVLIHCPTTARGGSLVRTRLSVRGHGVLPGFIGQHQSPGGTTLSELRQPEMLFKVGTIEYNWSTIGPLRFGEGVLYGQDFLSASRGPFRVRFQRRSPGDTTLSELRQTKMLFKVGTLSYNWSTTIGLW